MCCRLQLLACCLDVLLPWCVLPSWLLPATSVPCLAAAYSDFFLIVAYLHALPCCLLRFFTVIVHLRVWFVELWLFVHSAFRNVVELWFFFCLNLKIVSFRNVVELYIQPSGMLLNCNFLLMFGYFGFDRTDRYFHGLVK